MARGGGFFPWNTLDHSTSSESGADFSAFSAAGDIYHHDLGIPRPKLKSSGSGHHMIDGMSQEAHAHALHTYLDDGIRIPRAALGDNSSLASGSSEFTIREEIERRVITDITTTEMTTTKEEAQEAAEESRVEKESSSYQRFEGGAETSGMSSSSAYKSSSGQATSHGIAEHNSTDEQERGESVAEFSNGHAKEWRSTYKTGDYKNMQ